VTRNVQKITKVHEEHPFSVSMLEMWIVVAIQVIWLLVSLVL
jgi:hypothetical protein